MTNRSSNSSGGNSGGIVAIPITQEMRDIARRRSEDIPAVLRNSIRTGGGTEVGCLGEVVVEFLLDFLGVETLHVGDYNYDILAERGDDTVTVEVKTKVCGGEPKGNYDCSVADSNTRQDCDYYWFVRIRRDWEMAWVCGYMPKTQYYAEARKRYAGDTDHNRLAHGRPFRFHSDCWNLPISELYPALQWEEEFGDE